MFRPVGSQPPSVYWRRRLIVVGSAALLVVLLVITLRVVTSGNDNTAAGAIGTSTTDKPSTRPETPRTSPSPKVSSKHSSASRTGSSSAAAFRCQVKNLTVVAVIAKPAYTIGDQPMVELQVTNTGARACVQDLADKQIELKVYNGESRVWGSHDCEVQKGTDDRTLAVGRPVRVSITWSGLTSQPGCAGTRQRVGAGTYTLYALLSGKTGKAAQFSIS